MSSLEFGREFAEINEKSTISELIGFLVSSFRRKEFQLVEEILIKREDELKTLQKEQQNRSLLELELLGMKDDLNRLKKENFELQEELKKQKLESAPKLLEYEERMTKLEKARGNVSSVDAEIQTLACDSLANDLQKEGCNDGTLKITKDLLNSHSSAQNGVKNAHDSRKVGIDGLKQENENDSLYAAASKSVKRTCHGPRSPIVVEIIESDDEAPGDENPHVLSACSSEVDSREKGVTFMDSGSNHCPTQDKSKRNVRNNPLDNLPPKRKRSLTDTDDNQMVKERCQGLQIGSRKLDLCSSDDSSDYNSSDSENECSESLINMMIESLRPDCRKSL